MENNLVSVIIPAYNHEKYVQETINSIIGQTYQNIELIVIDDGSKDSTWQKIQEMKEICQKRFARVYFETKENEGTCKTLNKLISLVNGEFVYLIASDDKAKAQAIEKEVQFLQNNLDYVLVVGDNEFIDSSSKKIGWDKHRNSINLLMAEYKTFGEYLQNSNADVNFSSSRFGIYETFVKKNYIPNGYLIRKSALDQIGKFTPEAPLEDWWLHLQLSKVGKYKYIDEILFSYRWHDNNTAKRQDYMLTISYKTQLYEQALVASLDDKQWQQIFEKNITNIRIKFNFINIIKFYSVKNIDKKQYILEFFGCKIILMDKILSK
ncbi:MAG: glycosyltransferase [Campylobacter sp.]|nr:glycosyltransferase [Campylobacter sp.]